MRTVPQAPALAMPVAPPAAAESAARTKGKAPPPASRPTVASNGVRTAAPPPPPPLGASFGTQGPLTLVAAAPDRRWLVVCQARHDTNGDGAIRVEVGAQGGLSGDALEGFVIDEPGPGFRVDSFAGSDPTGRYVAFVRDGRLVLRDTTSHLDTELPNADVREDKSSFLHPRVLAFDPTGKRLLYLTLTGPSAPARIVVRELATGDETTIDPGAGDLYRADFDPTGESVVARVVTTDTNHDGRVTWKVRPAEKPSMHCVGPLPRYSAWERPGDDAESRVASITTSTTSTSTTSTTSEVALLVPGLVVPFGAARLEHDPDGALVLAEPSGERTVIADKACEAHLLHVDPARDAILYTCLDKKGHAIVHLRKGSVTRSLGFALTAARGDHFMRDLPRLIPFQPGAGAVLVDLDHGGVEPLERGDRILSTKGDRALVLRGHSLLVHELGGTEHVLGAVLPLSHVRHQGPVWFVPPFVVDLEAGETLGTSDARALAVATDGSLLVATPSSANRVGAGPLRWIAPTRERQEEKPSEPANTPIAGTGGDGLRRTPSSPDGALTRRYDRTAR